MAQRRGGSVAPVKQKLRKNHGPKRHMFKDYKPMIKAFADAGILDKYHDFESFQLSCAARGIKADLTEMWNEFRYLPRDKQKEYFKNIQEMAVAATKRAETRKKALKKAEEIAKKQ